MRSVVVAAYSAVASRKWILLCLMLGITLGCGLVLSHLKLEENIAFLLPDDRSRLSEDLQTLQSLPQQRSILITLGRSGNVTADELAQATIRMASALEGKGFTSVSCKPDLPRGNFFITMRNMVPGLFDQALEQRLAPFADPSRVVTQLGAQKRRLGGMEGLMLAPVVAADPLDMHADVLRRMQRLAVMKNLRVRHGVYMTEDEQHSLIVAQTSDGLSDSASAIALEKELNVLAAGLPEGVTSTAFGSALYTAANANAIIGDITRTSIFTGIALLLIIVCFLRTRQVFFLLLLPLFSYAMGATAVALQWSPASAMTFGFGPVLIGMTIDFGLHFYFVRGRTATPEGRIAAAATPVVLSALTTIGAFSLLLASPVPALRQLSLFIVAGLAGALGLALFVLPHVMRGVEDEGRDVPLQQAASSRYRACVLAMAGLFLVTALWGASRLTIQQHIREMGIQSPALQQAEREIATLWGTGSSRAILLAQGRTEDMALNATSAALAELPEAIRNDTLSLSFLVPPQGVQQHNHARWKAFWEAHPAIGDSVVQHGAELGFSKTAFTPFLGFIRQEPAVLLPATLTEMGFGNLVGYFDLPPNADGSGREMVSYLPDTPEVGAFFSDRTESRLHVRLISQTRLGEELAKVLTGTFATFVLYALGVICLILVLVLRRPKRILSALLPPLFGLLAMGAVLGFTARPLSLFSIAGALLILGHGVDYGVYITHAIQHNSTGAPKAILVSALTSLAGFGSLLFANHPALFDMGLSVFSGLLVAMPCALLLVPLLWRREAA